MHAINLAFAKISIGFHTINACIATSATYALLSFLLRSVKGTIVPFEVVFARMVNMIMGDIIFGMIKFIPVKNERTGQTKRWNIGTSMLFHSP